MSGDPASCIITGLMVLWPPGHGFIVDGYQSFFMKIFIPSQTNTKIRGVQFIRFNSRFLMELKTLTPPKAREVTPPDDQFLPAAAYPVLLDIRPFGHDDKNR